MNAGVGQIGFVDPQQDLQVGRSGFMRPGMKVYLVGCLGHRRGVG